MQRARGDKVAQLEHAVLELGTELYRLKSEIQILRKDASRHQSSLAVVKKFLDEQDILSTEDIELMLAEHEQNSFGVDFEHEESAQAASAKKMSH